VSSTAEPIAGGFAVPEGRRPDGASPTRPEGAAAAAAAAAPEGTAAPPARAAGVELLGSVAGSGYRRAPALVRRADGQTVQLTPLLYQLLEEIDGERDHGQLAAALSERIGKLADAEQVRYLVEAKLRPLGLLLRPDGGEPVVRKSNPLLALRLRAVVSNPAVTARIAAPFTPFFHLPLVVAFALGFVATTWWVGFEKGLASAASQALYEPSLLLLVLVLTLLSAGFHELGHAAACRYGGARPGAMGVGLYLVWPAFYTDVTDSYRLGRGARLRVDLGGLYFNAIFGVAMLGLWAVVGWDALLLVIAAQLVQMARQLIPVVRFDGYHVLADLTGVPDLFAHIKPTLLGLLPSRWGRGEAKALKPWARAVVTLWVLTVVPLLGALLVLIVLVLPRIIATAWDSLGLHWQAVVAHWGHADAAAVTVGLFSMLIIALPAVGIPYLLLVVARRTTRWAWRATAGSAPLRAAAAVAAAAIAGTVTWAWWPDDRYRPIAPDDRGRVSDVIRHGAPPPPVALVPAAATHEVAPDEAGPAPVVPAPRAPAPPAGRLMVAFVPKDAAQTGRRVVRPAILLPVPDDADAVVPVDADEEPPAEPWQPREELPDAPAPEVQPAEDAALAAASASEPSGGEPAPAPTTEWPFPFAPPREPQEGDNHVLVVNTTDGSTSSEVALALVWVTDGEPVEQRNEAWALARCQDCRTLAIAFQVLLVVDYAEIVTPINAAVAANWECESCVTHALAVQLLATLSRQPSEQTVSAITALWAQLEQVAQSFEQLPLDVVHAYLAAVRNAILSILVRNGELSLGESREDAETATESATAPDDRAGGDGADGAADVPGGTTPPENEPSSGSSTGAVAPREDAPVDEGAGDVPPDDGPPEQEPADEAREEEAEDVLDADEGEGDGDAGGTGSGANDSGESDADAGDSSADETSTP
jgi:putative peptide zinc metalloprotease protein